MLDENLPTFFFRPSSDRIPHHTTLFLSTNASDLEPIYDLHSLNPNHPSALNTYSIAILDSHNPSVIFGEALSRLQFTHPTAEEIRQYGSGQSSPKPIWPDTFTLQLYNPDQQVKVYYHESKWSYSYWEFDMPVQSFRTPSASAIDKAHDDPLADNTTPKLTFKWRREGRLSKDLVCSLSSKGNRERSKKDREPEITVAIYRGFKELIIYEPNLSRVEMEDLKGLEIVILLSAAVIRDLFFGDMEKVFHMAKPAGRKGSNSSPAGGRINPASPMLAPTGAALPKPSPPPPNYPNAPPPNAQYHPPAQQNHVAFSTPSPKPANPPRLTPAQQAEVNRLAAEEKASRKKIEKLQREDLKLKREEERDARRRAAANEKEAKRIQAEFEAEQWRQRRRRANSNPQAHPTLPPRPHSAQPGHGRPSLPSVPPHGPRPGYSGQGVHRPSPQGGGGFLRPGSYGAAVPQQQAGWHSYSGPSQQPVRPQYHSPPPPQRQVTGGGVFSNLLSVGGVGNVLFGGGHHSSGHSFTRPIERKRSSMF